MRESDHWGSRVASCTWILGDEGDEPCWKNKKLGARAGRCPWDGFSVPEVELQVTHQFGELDYNGLGAWPIRSGKDAYGDYDVFRVRREWFHEDGRRFSFAGNDLQWGGKGFQATSACGDAYLDPQAALASAEWKEERAACRKEGRTPDLDSWLLAKIEDGGFIDLAKRLSSYQKGFRFTVTGNECILRLEGDREENGPIWDGGIDLGSFEAVSEAVEQARFWLATKGNEVNGREHGRGIGSVTHWTVEVERTVYDEAWGWCACDRQGRTDADPGFNQDQPTVLYEDTLDGSVEKAAFDRAKRSYYDYLDYRTDDFDTVSECMALVQGAGKRKI